MDLSRTLVDQLRRYPTLTDLSQSAFYQEKRAALLALLRTPELVFGEGVSPHGKQFLRAVQWNIEKGKHFDGVVETLSTHPILRHADLIFLNEVDVGMARSGNRHVARELGDTLRMHVAFGPAHIELTKGTGDDLDAPGENEIGLQGNAILSRYPFGHVEAIGLPSSFEPFEFVEKRFGRRAALVAEVLINGAALIAVCVHLEVRTSPHGRAKQMHALLKRLREVDSSGPALLAGDLNTCTFPRGTPWRALQSTTTLLLSRPPRLKHRLLFPDHYRREPALDMLRKYGFSLDGLNSREATHRTFLGGLEENHQVPSALRQWAARKLAAYDSQLDFRLDWFAGRGVTPLRTDQIVDSEFGLAGTPPQTFRFLTHQGRPVSDHDPIVVDLGLPSSAP